ncbi:1-hydroxycarotenoid 3,4-desaturase CrtD [Anianabacter salinae]|uniref:1-hydroxycarotenoid 3,4-desaturase CrtD n=1 Tax=Anianabacter salinae TaxID=2851023 RepID=UPI00225DD9FB|nr:1-hydroxycarotenoid 3,4-desaturase CrtD [Anianabacter salinae]MBV0914137.1 phytoene desaturase [Anianabacter salinae]
MGDARQDKVVVIGAGMGGLCAAMRLSHAGLDVTVIDRAAAPGGKMRQVPTAAGPADAGPTVLTMRPVLEAVFEAAGASLDDHVTLTRAERLARHWWPDGSTLDLFADAARSEAAVGTFAGPKAAAQFRRFSARAAALFDAFDGSMMQSASPSVAALAWQVMARPSLIPLTLPGRTLAGYLRGAFDDPRLRQLFGRYATYVGGSPYASPALLALIWQAEAAGVWSVKGGMHALARAMAGVAEANGTQFIYGAEATRIEVQDGRTAAVHLASGERLPAGTVLFNGDPAALANGRLGDTLRKLLPSAATHPRSLSACVWTFAAAPRGAALDHHNVFFGGDARREFGPIAKGHLPEDPTLYVCAMDRAGGAVPDVPERFEIIMNAPAGLTLSEEDQDRCRSLTFRCLSDRGLTFDPVPGLEALTTPLAFDALFPSSQGALYGRSPHGMLSALRRPRARTALPGLYLCGGGTHPGAGVPMAALSGRHAAETILTDRTFTSPSRRTAMPGGMSTGSATAGHTPSR